MRSRTAILPYPPLATKGGPRPDRCDGSEGRRNRDNRPAARSTGSLASRRGSPAQLLVLRFREPRIIVAQGAAASSRTRRFGRWAGCETALPRRLALGAVVGRLDGGHRHDGQRSSCRKCARRSCPPSMAEANSAATTGTSVRLGLPIPDTHDHALSRFRLQRSHAVRKCKAANPPFPILGARQHRCCGFVRGEPTDSPFSIRRLHLHTPSTIALTLGAAALATTAFAQHSGLSAGTVIANEPATANAVTAPRCAVVVGIDRATYTHSS